MDLELIRKNYESLTDEKIAHLANFESHQLNPEVIQILIDEIKKRGLSDGLIDEIAASNKEIDPQEILDDVELIRSLPDPTTGATKGKLNATVVSHTFSVIFFTQTTNKIFFGNSRSIQEKLKDATTATWIGGWWGIPWGVIRTISSLRHNKKMTRIDYEAGPSEVLLQFVAENRRFIEANRNDPARILAKLRELMN